MNQEENADRKKVAKQTRTEARRTGLGQVDETMGQVAVDARSRLQDVVRGHFQETTADDLPHENND